MADFIFPFIFSLFQLFMLGTALMFGIIGFVLTFSPWLQRIGTVRVKARVAGINVIREDSQKPTARVPYPGEKYYRVYEYTTPDGVKREAEGNTGTNMLGSRLPGDEAILYLRKDDYDGPMEHDYLLFFFGMPFLFAGVFFSWFSIRQVEVNPASIAAGVALLLWAGWKMRKVIKPRHLWDTRESFVARKKEKRAAKRAAKAAQCQRLSDAELRQRINYLDKSMAATLPFLFVIAAILVAGGAFLGQSQYRFERSALGAQGKVVSMEMSDDTSMDSDPVYYPIVRFTTAEGKTIKFRGRSGSNPPLYRRGQEVNVLYLPENPEKKVQIDLGPMNYGWSAALGGAGAVFLFLALRTRGRIEKRQRRL